MKNYLDRLAAYTALILLSALPFSFDVEADTEKKTGSNPPSWMRDSKKSAQTLLAEKNQRVVEEARAALSGTRKALLALVKNDAETAHVQLQDVLSKLDTLLADHPDMNLITADVEADILDFNGEVSQVKKAIAQADDFLDDGKVQSARRILAGLGSEIQITTINIPLASYPEAVKSAIANIDAGDLDTAEAGLSAVLGTLIEVTEVMPLPVLRAEALLSKAMALEHDEDLHQEASRTEIANLVRDAKNQLQIAQLLGYGDDKDYQPLYTAIDDLESVIHSEKFAAAWEALKQKLSDLKNKIIQTGPEKAG